MDVGYEMLFETTIRTFLGDKADHIAGQVHNENHRKEWYQKALKKIIEKVQKIETTTKHSEHLANTSQRALKCLESKSYNETEFTLYILRLTGALLGIHPAKYCIATPMYYQTPDQHFTEAIISGGDALLDYYDKNNFVAMRRKVVKQLKEEGLSDFDISLVLNTSEYQVKKLRKEL
ncbi:MAG: hypothetical protein HOP25_05030 [Methylotenera sp.]|nr:hypothetical protein [Methylotenera sp.]